LVVILLVVLLTVARGAIRPGANSLRSDERDNVSGNGTPDERYYDAAPTITVERDFGLLYVDEKVIQSVHTVYVIPGGGNLNGAYPEWTKRRAEAAYKHYSHTYPNDKGVLFLALSAGSLNSANSLASDNRIVFESQHTLRHLVQLGVPKEMTYGDSFSWDTVTNAMVLRMFVEGVQEFRRSNEDNFITASAPVPPDKTSDGTAAPRMTKLKPLILEVFISDFHADRVRAAFDWVLNLAPKVQATELRINSVGSIGIDFGSQLDYAHRIAHEAEGVKKIAENAKTIRTMAQFNAFLMLGGHQGLYKYLHYDYQRSQGAGW
jgi:hypothetical protein